MKKKEKKQLEQPMTPEEEFHRREQIREKNNRIKNKPILVMTYFVVTVFVGLIFYVMYFMHFKAELIIANSRNIRQDSFADVVERGDIITSDGVVIATSATDENGVTTRTYPYSNMFAHVVGYDSNGKAGLELMGNFYMLRTHINIMERVYVELKEKKNRGDNLITTINYDLQNVAYNALGYCNGAVLVTEPSTGKILAMVSKPDYDPNNMNYIWDYLNSEEGKDSSILLNRATQGLYAPGSTFKVVTLLEYIRENPRYDRYSFICNGNDIFSGVSIRCSNNHVHGEESLQDSLAYSCNVSFANIGTTLNKGEYRNTADELFFNTDLPYDGACVKSVFEINENSSNDQLPQTVIGQGNTQISPLHNAIIFGAIANDGVVMRPYLMDSVENDDGTLIKKFGSKSEGNIMTKEEADTLTEYMKAVCDYGTAAGYFSGLSYDVAGKTGTAEYDNNGHCNSWFVGFSNPDDPDILVSVIVEDSTTTGLTGVSVAKQIFDAYYR